MKMTWRGVLKKCSLEVCAEGTRKPERKSEKGAAPETSVGEGERGCDK